ncbi:hypothetical protein B0J14DRAFT_279213 [Halenospora varia]|nr:hypothetical protein B0J14DRAFT_279213 [Halenospora varia]
MSAASVSRVLRGSGERLVWKAYAIALRMHLTTIDKLDQSSKAIFVASPFQYGIPAGSLVPDEITNEQLYRKADAIQDRRRPGYSSDGGSYFEFARTYLKTIQNTSSGSANDSRITEVQKQVWASQEHSANAYLKDVDLYKSSGGVEGTSMSFDAWMSKFGIFSLAARKEQGNAEKKLQELAENPIEGITIALASMRLAAETKKSNLGSNMPCTAQDLPSLFNTSSAADRQVNPDSIFYRPQYSISGLDQRVESWISQYHRSEDEAVKLQLDLEEAKNTAWADLGFPHLDQDPTNAEDLEVTSDFDISLKLTGMQAFDVERGFWDIDTSAQNFERAPNRCMKTTRLLLGYGAELEITPEHPRQLQSSFKEKKNSSILGFPVTSSTVDKDVVRISSNHTGIPALLAVLAKES